MEAVQALENIQPAENRSQVITVTERQVAKSADGPVETTKETTVLVRPLPFRRWLTAMQYVGRMMQYIPDGGIDFNDAAKLAVSIVYMLGEAEADLIALASLATDQPAEFFDRIDPDDGVKIIIAVVQVNKDFFVQKVLPLLEQVAPEAKETFGLTQSPSFSDADTDGQTS